MESLSQLYRHEQIMFASYSRWKEALEESDVSEDFYERIKNLIAEKREMLVGLNFEIGQRLSIK